jgi:hypothetical protein
VYEILMQDSGEMHGEESGAEGGDWLITKISFITWFEGKWMELEDIMLGEVSQIQKDKSHMFSPIFRK